MAIHRQLFTKYFANSFLRFIFVYCNLADQPSGGLFVRYFLKSAVMEMIPWLVGSFHSFVEKVNLTR